MALDRPRRGEHREYFSRYIDRVGATDILGQLTTQVTSLEECMGRFGEEGSLHRYAEGKWSVKEVLGHLSDVERVFAYRAVSFARTDAAELPGVDETAWVNGARFDATPLDALLDEFAAVRGASVALFRGLSGQELNRSGVADGAQMTVRAIPWLLVGHVDHHLAVIEERYQRV